MSCWAVSECAVEHLGVRLIVVLGHERCGAITAAVTASGATAGHLGSIMRAIRPALEKAKAQLSDQAAEDTVDALVERTVDAHVVEIVASLVPSPSLPEPWPTTICAWSACATTFTTAP